jgi:hypothetical protein
LKNEKWDDHKDNYNSWFFWRSAEQLGTMGSFYTDEFATQGDGYVVDFDLGDSSETFTSDIQNIFENKETPFLSD